jgi:hypothetical protein
MLWITAMIDLQLRQCTLIREEARYVEPGVTLDFEYAAGTWLATPVVNPTTVLWRSTPGGASAG